MNDMNRSDSEKEIAIYEGVCKLIRQDVNLSQVTASEIAQAAGIGKGTLYNYFSTKDEIIARTVFTSSISIWRRSRRAWSGRPALRTNAAQRWSSSA